MKERTRQTYMERFGVRILEGYGVTETAPVLAMNTPIANKPGTVGRLSPLMQARLEPVPGIDEGGRLFVRGPQRHARLLPGGKSRACSRPPAGGWHDTGDIVAIDAQGFITIKGRAKRFAKIARRDGVAGGRRGAGGGACGPARRSSSCRCRMRARASGWCC